MSILRALGILKRVFTRSLFYFRTGYAYYLVFLMNLATTSSVVYYLVVNNVPIMKEIFPSFRAFLLAVVFAGIPLGVFIGYLHFKRLPFYRSELDVQVEANPYAMRIATPASLPLYRTLSALAKKHGVDARELDEVIARTEKRFPS